MDLTHFKTCPLPACPGGCDTLECPGCGVVLEIVDHDDPTLGCPVCGYWITGYEPCESWIVIDGEGSWELPDPPADTAKDLRVWARWLRGVNYDVGTAVIDFLRQIEENERRIAELETRAAEIETGVGDLPGTRTWTTRLKLDVPIEQVTIEMVSPQSPRRPTSSENGRAEAHVHNQKRVRSR